MRCLEVGDPVAGSMTSTIGAQPLRGGPPSARRLALAALGHLADRAGPVARSLARHKQSTGLFVSGLGPAMLALLARGQTRFVHCVHCARTDGRESDDDARDYARGQERSASQRRLRADGRPPRSGSATVVARRQRAASGRTRGGRYPGSAIWGAPRNAATGSARAQRALHDLTRGICPSAANEVSAASYAARARCEYRRAAGAQRRPLPYEPTPGTACRDAALHPQPTAQAARRRQSHCNR